MARSSTRPDAAAAATATAAATAGKGRGSGKVPAKKRKSPLTKGGGTKAKKKYDWRKYIKICTFDRCTNQAKKGGVCIRHGAKVKRCSSEGCKNQAKSGGVCQRHGAKAKRCSSEGCTNQAKTGGVCQRHGAKVKLCSYEGCANLALQGGVCTRHGAKIKVYRCSAEGCSNQAQQGGLCMRHGAKVKLCSREGCTNQAKTGGVCKSHGAKVKLCSYEGCTNQAKTGGVCYKNGAKVKLCSKEGCANQARKGGVCWTHGEKPKCSASECTNYASGRGVCWRHGAERNPKPCSIEGCKNLAQRKGGLCYSHWAKKHRNEQAAAEQDAVAVPALPPVELTPTEPECGICFEQCNDLATCAIDSACKYTICHDCLVSIFSCPLQMINGELVEYDPTQCPNCRQEGAFSLDVRDADREMEAEYYHGYDFGDASLAASYASTSHEQGDSPWEMSSDEGDDEDD